MPGIDAHQEMNLSNQDKAVLASMGTSTATMLPPYTVPANTALSPLSYVPPHVPGGSQTVHSGPPPYTDRSELETGLPALHRSLTHESIQSLENDMPVLPINSAVDYGNLSLPMSGQRQDDLFGQLSLLDSADW